MDRVGRKLLATGNGRCNLMNTGLPRYPGGAKLAGAVLSRCGAAEQRRFWEAHGLRMREEDGGRVYPASGQATTVLDVLRLAMEASGVRILADTAVTGLRQEKGRWAVSSGDRVWTADRVIVCGGGCAQPKLGSDGSCVPLLRALGLRAVKQRPALTQIDTDVAPIRGLSGIRVRCGVRVTEREACLHEERGELLFTDHGVSGVCVMQCARWARPGALLQIDLLPGLSMTYPELCDELERRRGLWGDLPCDRLLTGLVVPKLATALLRAAGLDGTSRPIRALSPRGLRELAGVMRCFPLKVTGIHGFEQAQVTVGGIACEHLEPTALHCLPLPGLHICGELLDVDGDCGGYNLMFAFGSGLLAGCDGRPFPW